MKKYSCILFCLLFLCSAALAYSQQSESIKVLSFNIRYNNPQDGENAWPLRKEQVVSVIRFHGADIIGLQEAQADQLQYLERELSEYGWTGTGRLDGGEGEEFCAVFFRKSLFELEKSYTFWLSKTPEVKVSKSWDSSLPRVCTVVLLKFKGSNDTLAVLNTHFDHRGVEARRESANLIVKEAEKLHDLPLVLTGDFNCRKGSEPINILEKSLAEASSSSHFPSHGPAWTYHGFNGFSVDNSLIDFIFVNEKVSVIRHGILADNIDGRYPSDHLPVLVEILLKKR
jgi:endonuclease/exonuclease/phosphatase family metal-dependent hydrolase